MMNMAFLTATVCATLLISAVAAQAEDSALVTQLDRVARTGFLTGNNAGKLAVVEDLGNGSGETAAQNGEMFGITTRNKCYVIKRTDVHDDLVWLMVNNGHYGPKLGHVKLTITSYHYKVGEKAGPSVRKPFRTREYDPIEFDISPDIEKADPSVRPIFYAGVADSDLVILDIKSSNKSFQVPLDGRYYLLMNDEIAYEHLVPGCKWTVLISPGIR